MGAGPRDAQQEQLYHDWLFSSASTDEQAVETQMQQRALDQAWVVPLGQYFQSAAWRRTLTGFQKGPAPVFWNVQKGLVLTVSQIFIDWLSLTARASR